MEEFGELATEAAFVGGAGESVEGDTEQAESGDIRMVEMGLSRIVDAGDIGGFDEMNNWATGERELLEPVGRAQYFLKLAETGAATAEKDLVREHFGQLELFEGDLDARKPDGEIALDGEHHLVPEVSGDFGRIVDGELIFLSGVEIDVESFSDLVGEAATADAEHLRPLDATIVDDGNIGRAATDIHDDTGEIAVKLVAEASAANRKRFDSDGKQIKRELGANFLDGRDMDERSESGVELEDDVGSLKADWVADFVTVDSNRDDSRIDEADFNVRVVGFVGDFLAGALAGAILYALDDERHFLLGERFVAALAAVANGRRVAFD